MKKLLTTFLFLFILFYNSFAKNITATIQNGVLNLEKWELEKDGNLQLSGNVEFYWNKFLFTQNNLLIPDYTFIPGKWPQNQKYNNFGYGTYRFKIIVSESSVGKIGALKIGDVCTAYSIYINGKKCGFSGTAETTKEKTEPYYSSKIISFVLKKENEIVFQVSNFHNRSAGLWGTIVFGSSENINRLRDSKVAFEMFLFGSILMAGFTHIIIYFFRTKEKVFGIFGLFCTVIALRIIMTGERIFNNFNNTLNWEILFKIEFLTFYIGVLLFLLFFKSMFPKEFSKRFYSLFLWITILHVLMVLFSKASFYTRYQEFFQFFSIIMAFYIILSLIIAVIQRRDGAVNFIIGALVIIATYINDILYSNELINSWFLSPFGFIFFIISQSLNLSIRFSDSLNTTEKLLENVNLLNKELETKVALRTSELATANLELKNANIAAEARSYAKERFLLNMSHEIRTPLHGITGMTELLSFTKLDSTQKNIQIQY